jgi:hypothetical protein
VEATVSQQVGTVVFNALSGCFLEASGFFLEALIASTMVFVVTCLCVTWVRSGCFLGAFFVPPTPFRPALGKFYPPRQAVCS